MWHDVGRIVTARRKTRPSVEEIEMSTMYKPLSLVVRKGNRSFDRTPLFRAPSFLADEPARAERNAGTRHIPKARTTKIAQAPKAAQGAKAAPQVFPVSKDADFPPMSRPRCIKSYRSDRMAIYDEKRDTFHAYSVTEAISQSGLTFQEAVDWVDDRLVLVGKGISPGKMAVALSLVLASGLVAVLLIAALISILV